MSSYFTKQHPLNVPAFLVGTKWDIIVKQTNTVDKFEDLAIEILDCFYPIHWFNIFKMLQRDIFQEHKDSSICEIVTNFEQNLSAQDLNAYDVVSCQSIRNKLQVWIYYRRGYHLLYQYI